MIVSPHRVSIAVLCLASFSIAFSQQQINPAATNESVVLTATVKTASGNDAVGLAKDAFHVVEGKTDLTIDDVEGGDYPASIAILVDTSASVEPSEGRRLQALGEAIKKSFEAAHPSNEYFLAAFDADLRILAEWKTGAELITEKFPIEQTRKNTAMFDACFVALEHFRTAKYERKALMVISDGLDNVSRHSLNQLRDRLKQADVIFYGILTPGGADVGSSLGAEGATILSELADVTGGEVYRHSPRDDRDLSEALNTIVTEVRHQYRIRFHANSTEPANKWRRIKVRVDPPKTPAEFRKLKIRVRPGFYTP